MKILKNFLIASLVLMLAAPFTSCDNTKKEYEKNIAQGDAAMKDLKYEDALGFYTKAAELQPENKYPAGKIMEIKKILAEKKAAENYTNEIDKAEALFDDGRFEEALAAYRKALSYKPDESYPQERIDEIQRFLEENPETETVEAPVKGNNYHVVIGSFELEENARKLKEKLKEQGIDTRLVSRNNGEYTAVVLWSFPDVHSAFNKLADARSYTGHAWVLYQKI